MNEYQKWLVDWFAANSGDAAGKSAEEILESDYFADGFVDSFGVISLVAEIEDAFSVRFSEDDFQNRDFSRVKGLADIIKGYAQK